MISLAENKRKQIRREVCDAIDALETDRQVLKLKTQRRDSLTQSIRSAEKAKDEVPLDIATHLENQLEKLKLDSEIIHQHFVVAADEVRLRQAQGLLTTNAFDQGMVLDTAGVQSGEIILQGDPIISAGSTDMLAPVSATASPAPRIIFNAAE